MLPGNDSQTFPGHGPTPYVAALLFALFLVFAPGGQVQAIECPPGFETLPGCTNGGGAAGGTGNWSQETIAGMNVRIYTPNTAPAHPAGRALMVNLHGCVQTNTDLANAGNWEATADEYGMIVAVPGAPNGGVLLGCWDYYDSNHTRSNRHNGNLLGLVDNLLGRSDLEIDADQVYLSGLSSGGGQTMVTGCLAPDVFAGIGINAGPTVGTSSGEISYVATTETAGRNTCLSFAGSASNDFDTQITSVIYGNDDSIVAPGYNTLNAAIMAGIYGATDSSSFSLSGLEGNNTSGSGTLYSDADGPRVSLIDNSGMGHNWPAGGGPGGSYITPNSINYPAYITAFFFENNRRIDADDGGNGDDGDNGDGDNGNGDDGNGDDGNGDDDFPCSETTASTYAHTQEGRAYHQGGIAYANGSDDDLGLWNTFNTVTLAETDEGHFQLGSCP
ncbi:MAG: PHB depolymerase family esterase [Ectothiorhodospiraceae bacterium]|nr:PHB depolymerase family esterase [Ectothiorhodospiraceae bacterium]